MCVVVLPWLIKIWGRVQLSAVYSKCGKECSVEGVVACLVGLHKLPVF